jgi:hypothetical protein
LAGAGPRAGSAIDLVDGHDVEAKASPNLGRSGIQILVEEKAHFSRGRGIGNRKQAMAA